MGQKFAYFQIEVKQMPEKFAKFTLLKESPNLPNHVKKKTYKYVVKPEW